MRARAALFCWSFAAVGAVAGCGQRDASIVAVPIGSGPVFRPPSLSLATRAAQSVGRLDCGARATRRFGAHVELFARGRGMVVPAGIGIAPPRIRDGAYVDGGRCHYPLRTREPTGVIEIAHGTRATVGDLFALWGQPLGRRRMAAFSGRVRAAVGGRDWRGDPREIALTKHAQVVLQVGPPIAPHARYCFPPGM
ncbi:MAG TPA: hypothetical protein VGO80_23150 [Solirubrobacteraceae bacterium]|jgi:hypothetical protein|nr:hypothetical protein [Solirubrobacteraceae bacterium]